MLKVIFWILRHTTVIALFPVWFRRVIAQADHRIGSLPPHAVQDTTTRNFARHNALVW